MALTKDEISYFDVALNDGATIAVGGKPHDGHGGGHYVQPTLLTGAHSKLQYGLTGYIGTSDMRRALRVADALETGMIWLNSESLRHLPTPFGGMKSSGIGRDDGDYSFDFYIKTKHVSLARGAHKIQRLGIPSS